MVSPNAIPSAEPTLDTEKSYTTAAIVPEPGNLSTLGVLTAEVSLVSIDAASISIEVSIGVCN